MKDVFASVECNAMSFESSSEDLVKSPLQRKIDQATFPDVKYVLTEQLNKPVGIGRLQKTIPCLQERIRASLKKWSRLLS